MRQQHIDFLDVLKHTHTFGFEDYVKYLQAGFFGVRYKRAVRIVAYWAAMQNNLTIN